MKDSPTAGLPRRALRAELASLPGWVTARSGKALRRAWQFRSKEAASGFAFALLAVSFERGLFADWSLTGTSVGVLLRDPLGDSVTGRVVDLAHRFSQLAGAEELRDNPASMDLLRGTALRLARELAETEPASFDAVR